MYGNEKECKKNPGIYKPLPNYMKIENTPKKTERLIKLLQEPKENGK